MGHTFSRRGRIDFKVEDGEHDNHARAGAYLYVSRIHCGIVTSPVSWNIFVI